MHSTSHALTLDSEHQQQRILFWHETTCSSINTRAIFYPSDPQKWTLLMSITNLFLPCLHTAHQQETQRRIAASHSSSIPHPTAALFASTGHGLTPPVTPQNNTTKHSANPLPHAYPSIAKHTAPETPLLIPLPPNNPPNISQMHV